jgi:hypothetical protein
MAVSTGKTLYESLLREDFHRLPLSLQQFHRHPQGATAKGALTIRHSQGFFYRIFRLFLRLPPPGEDIPAQLCVIVRKETKVWVRKIGDYRLESVQWRKQDNLVEKIGFFSDDVSLERGKRKDGVPFPKAENRATAHSFRVPGRSYRRGRYLVLASSRPGSLTAVWAFVLL